MTKNTVNTVPQYVYGSPRYNALRNYDTTLVPENYRYYDGLNGTYDKYFPLYVVTDTDDPKYLLTNPTNQSTPIKGDLALRPYREKYKHRQIGKKTKPTGIFNSNLAFKDLYYKEWFSVKLNPAWTTLQTDGTTVNYLIRCLGNTYVTRDIHAFTLDETNTIGIITGTFPPGIIVSYKKNLWKCLKETNKYPAAILPKKDTPVDPNWQSLATLTNVFNADIFSIGKDTTFKYTTSVTEDSRTFDPGQEHDDSLVCYNVAFYND